MHTIFTYLKTMGANGTRYFFVLKQHCKRYKLQLTAGLLMAGIVLYAGFFVAPKKVVFSFASEQTCIGRLSLLPDVWRSNGSEAFQVKQEGVVKIGDISVFSTQNCVTANDVPTEGTYMASMELFGAGILARPLAIDVVSVPTPDKSALKDPVPATKPLTIDLSDVDVVSRYQLAHGDMTTTCTSHASKPSLECDLTPLRLEPDQQYQVSVIQSIGAGSTEVLVDNLATLDAVKVAETSVANDQVIHAKLTSVAFKVSKQLVTAKAALVDDETQKEIDSSTKVEGDTVNVEIGEELPRGKAYILRLLQADAMDGSSLLQPYEIRFSTSNGPKVTGVNIEKYGVISGSRVVVTFDQPLSKDQDITKLVSTTGVGSVVSKVTNQVIINLAGGDRCAPFAIKIEPGITSEHDITSKDGWQYTSRIACQTTSVYGYSVNRRPLVAYHFGSSGPVTMYVGAIHGNEPSSSGLMKAWINDLEANPSLYDGKRIVVVPTINPDGVAAGTRDNARGVNLNRNFPTNDWKSDVNDTDGFKEGGGGSAPLSEPEANALANLTLQLRPRLLASFHAIGSLVVGDPGGVSAGYAAAYARSVGYGDYTYRSSPFNYDTFGGYEDWTYSKQGIPSMIVELSSYTYYNFGQHQAALRMLLN